MRKGEIYEDKAGEWRWRVVTNGQITGRSEEGFKKFEYAHADAEKDNPGTFFEVKGKPADPPSE